MNEACGIFSVPSVASPIAQPSPAFGARRSVRCDVGSDVAPLGPTG